MLGQGGGTLLLADSSYYAGSRVCRADGQGASIRARTCKAVASPPSVPVGVLRVKIANSTPSIFCAPGMGGRFNTAYLQHFLTPKTLPLA